MIRVEYKTVHNSKGGVFCEGTQAEAEAYVLAMRKAGVIFEYVNYYDKEKRELDIMEGRV